MKSKRKTEFLKKMKELKIFALHVRNCFELGPHPLRAEGVYASDLLEEVERDVLSMLKEVGR